MAYARGMPPSHADIASSVAEYAEAIGAVAESAGGVIEFLQGLYNPKARARRLRRRAARLWRVSRRAHGHGYDVRAANLRARSVDAWTEAQRIDPITVAAAIVSDRGNV